VIGPFAQSSFAKPVLSYLNKKFHSGAVCMRPYINEETKGAKEVQEIHIIIKRKDGIAISQTQTLAFTDKTGNTSDVLDLIKELSTILPTIVEGAMVPGVSISSINAPDLVRTLKPLVTAELKVIEEAATAAKAAALAAQEAEDTDVEDDDTASTCSTDSTDSSDSENSEDDEIIIGRTFTTQASVLSAAELCSDESFTEFNTGARNNKTIRNKSNGDRTKGPMRGGCKGKKDKAYIN
jgi:hypothetical protein